MLLVPERCYVAGAVHDGWAVRLEGGWITAVGPPAALSPRPSAAGDVAEESIVPLSPQAITDVWVHGRRVVQDGRLTTVEETALLAETRALTREWRA